VLVDPLPLSESALASLGKVAAICLTAGGHQRSSWRYRKRFGAAVHAPEGADLDEPPDAWYSDGQILPGGLRAISTPGFAGAHCALLLEGSGRGALLFAGDLVMRGEEGPFALISEEYCRDAKLIRESVARLLDVGPETLCPAHGAPAARGGSECLQEALKR
jgi:glyoxylase-like metal-dependent hydrolase (beta-lactamase superfamily II)